MRRGITRNMGGTLAVRSTLVRRNSLSNNTKNHRNGSMNPVVDRVKMKKALVVEDHPDSLDILTHILKFLGFTVIRAKHGAEGVEKAFKDKPQLILMDILMPKMDGREATRQIRSNPETKNIPILAITALCCESELMSCLEAGCSDYIVKPVAIRELQGKIQASR